MDAACLTLDPHSIDRATGMSGHGLLTAVGDELRLKAAGLHTKFGNRKIQGRMARAVCPRQLSRAEGVVFSEMAADEVGWQYRSGFVLRKLCCTTHGELPPSNPANAARLSAVSYSNLRGLVIDHMLGVLLNNARGTGRVVQCAICLQPCKDLADWNPPRSREYIFKYSSVCTKHTCHQKVTTCYCLWWGGARCCQHQWACTGWLHCNNRDGMNAHPHPACVLMCPSSAVCPRLDTGAARWREATDVPVWLWGEDPCRTSA